MYFVTFFSKKGGESPLTKRSELLIILLAAIPTEKNIKTTDNLQYCKLSAVVILFCFLPSVSKAMPSTIFFFVNISSDISRKRV